MIDKVVLLDIARSDLHAANLLLKENHYSQAIFFTHQSVEKVSKYLALESEAVSHERLHKEIGHDPVKGFRLTLQRLKEKIDEQLLSSAFRNNKIPDDLYDNIDAKIDQFVELSSKASDLNEGQLNAVIMLLTDLDTNSRGISGQQTALLNEGDLIHSLKEIGLINDQDVAAITSMIEKNGKYRDYLKKIASAYTHQLPDYLNATVAIFYLSVVFADHAVSTRYPNPRTGTNPLTLYTNDAPIVKHLRLFHYHLNKAIRAIIEFNDKLAALELPGSAK